MKKPAYVVNRKQSTRGARPLTLERFLRSLAGGPPSGVGIDLEGKVAMVTGGGTGIGKAVSLALGRSGAIVVVNYRSLKAPAEATAAQIRAEGGRAAAVCADVSSPKGATAAVKAAVSEFGRLDILVNNVGDFLHKPLLEVTSEEWTAVVRSNLDSAFFCSLRAVPHMRKRGWGRIVNLGVAGCDNLRAFPNTTAYNVAKTGVLILAKSLAREVAPFGITVNVVAPGLIDTGALARREMKKLEPTLPMRRAGTPDEVAEAVLFLVSERASYITGACVPVSGGWLL
ncbi:MAG: SDR family oxidoreductase [Candidatus Eisenbacteria bacterium]|nr:SDR family oxidoreductase [Candidatus Eisenbacteria bacterium]